MTDFITFWETYPADLCNRKGSRQDAEKINRQNIQLHEAFHNPGDMGDQERIELTILRRKTQRQYCVYVVDWQYINTKFWKKFPTDEKKKDLKKKRIQFNRLPKG